MRARAATAASRRDAQFYWEFGTTFYEDRIEDDHSLDIKDVARRAIAQVRSFDGPGARTILFDQEICRL
jgi:hypothetical protein